jgi:hypothetical protein
VVGGLVLWAALAFAFAGNWFGPKGDILRAAGAVSVVVMAVTSLVFLWPAKSQRIQLRLRRPSGETSSS